MSTGDLTLDLRSPQASDSSPASPVRGRSPVPDATKRRGKRGGGKNRKRQSIDAPASPHKRQAAGSPAPRPVPSGGAARPLIPKVTQPSSNAPSGPRVTCRWLGGGEGGHNQPRRPASWEYQRAPRALPFTAQDARQFEEATRCAVSQSVSLTELLRSKERLLQEKEQTISSLERRNADLRIDLERSDFQRRHWSTEAQRLAERNKDAVAIIQSLRRRAIEADLELLPDGDQALNEAIAAGTIDVD